MNQTPGASAGKRTGVLGRVLGGVLATLLVGAFLMVSLIIGGVAFNSVFQWWGARDWTPVQATVLTATLDTSSDSDGTTYRVDARYRYQYDGQAYESDRVDFHPGSDNVGSYHRDMYRRLNAARESGEAVTAWVNPDDPSSAVLHRQLRWGLFGFMLLFPLIFGGVAVAVAVGMLARRKRKQRREVSRERHPDAPWQWNERWSGATLSSQSRQKAWMAVVFAVVWNAISVPLWFVLPQEVADGNLLALLGFLFPLVGVGLVIWAAREVIRRRRYGESQLRLDALPVPLGGMLRARLDVPARLEARELSVHLTCVRRVRTGSGKQRRTREHLLWEDSRRVKSGSGHAPGTTSARIEVRLPGDRPQVSHEDPDNRVIWRADIRSEEPGVDYKSVFELPVFDTGEAAVDESAMESGSGPESARDDWRQTGVIQGYGGGGQRFFFPRFRMLRGGLTTLLFALVFLGSGLGLALGAGHWIFGGIFVLVGALILSVAISMMFQRSEIIIASGRVRWRHGVVGGWREAETGAVKAIRIRKTGSAGHKLYFRLELEQWGANRSSALADWVPNERAAGALAKHLESLAGVDTPRRSTPE